MQSTKRKEQCTKKGRELCVCVCDSVVSLLMARETESFQFSLNLPTSFKKKNDHRIIRFAGLLKAS